RGGRSRASSLLLLVAQVGRGARLRADLLHAASESGFAVGLVLEFGFDLALHAAGFALVGHAGPVLVGARRLLARMEERRREFQAVLDRRGLGLAALADVLAHVVRGQFALALEAVPALDHLLALAGAVADRLRILLVLVL